MSKQDRIYTRTASDLERKLNAKENFAKILGIATDARNAVNRVESDLESQIKEQYTSITRDTEQIIMTALKSYVESGDYETFKETVEAEFAVMANKIAMNFTTTTSRIETVEGETIEKINEIYKNIAFGGDGITIGSSENAIKMNLDNDQLVISKNGVEIIRLDIDNSILTNVWIKAGGRLRLGNFAWVVQDNGVPVFMKVGE